MFEDKVDALVERVTKDFDPKAIIIFGSVAKGTATEDSDLDVAVIMDTDLSWTQRVVAVRRALNPSGVSSGPIHYPACRKNLTDNRTWILSLDFHFFWSKNKKIHCHPETTESTTDGHNTLCP